ncbi:MAG TPA: efflux RND transporter permease subunit [Roseomonas sp.]|jgi:HAE1 family hydrophobic/amphiphilic exporter-1
MRIGRVARRRGPGESYHNASAWAIRNPVPTCVLFVVLALAGLWSLSTLRVNNTPDIDVPAVTVTVMMPGAAPSEIETLVTRRVEDAVARLGDVRRSTSTVTTGISTTVIEFALGSGIDRAANDVRDQLNQIRPELPSSIREPVVARVDAAGGAILTYAVSSSRMSIEEVSAFVDDTLAPALRVLPGVGQVNRIGGTDREIRVELRPDRLLALGITAAEVNVQLRNLNIDLPGGRVADAVGDQAIRALGAASSIAELRQRRIALPSGGAVRLADIASVLDTSTDPRSAALLDGRPVVAFEILRTRGSSELRVADAVSADLALLKRRNPGLEIALVTGSVAFARSAYAASVEALIVGTLLAVVAVGAFLGDWRATLISAIAIPLSLLPTFAVMAWLDLSLNNVTLLALALVVGVLVDDAIVEVENIACRLQADPAIGAREAALDGSAEIGLAVVATTAAIAAVFVPVSLMPGVAGQYFRQFGITVIVAVGFSLLVARLLTPLMCAHFLRPSRTAKPTVSGASGLGFCYRVALGWCLRHRPAALLLGAIALTVGLAPLPFIPTDFIRGTDRDRSLLTLELPPGSSLRDAENASREAARLLLARPEVISVFSAAGDTGVTASGQGGGDPRLARLVITLLPREQRSLHQRELEEAVRPALETLRGVRIRFGSDRQRGARVQIALAGPQGPAVAAAAGELMCQMRDLPGFIEPRASTLTERAELQVAPHWGHVAELGVSVAEVATTLRIATTGDVAHNLPRFGVEGRDIPIRVVLEEAGRGTESLRALRIPTRTGAAVPLEVVATIRHAASPAAIERVDRLRKATVEAELDGLPLGQAHRLVGDLPIMRQLPPGVSEVETGDREIMRELFGNLGASLGAGVLAVYLVLVILFRSVLQPLTILTALPFAIAGAVLALWFAREPLGISATIGILLLLGIVAKNSILMVDQALARQRSGSAAGVDFIAAAALRRARPIVMTTCAMCAGMAHVAMGIGADAEFRAPMALVLIGGLIASTLLSLLIVPVVYSYVDQFGRAITRRRLPAPAKRIGWPPRSVGGSSS